MPFPKTVSYTHLAITFNLDAKQENIMIQEGFLKREGDKYYLPEIIRHALNFKYEKGARPKVLSLVFGKWFYYFLIWNKKVRK